MLQDKNGKELKVGQRVETYIQGCKVVTKVIKLRPRKKEVVLEEGGYYKPATWVTIVED